MRVVERITGTAGRYGLTGTVSLDDVGNYVARATTCLLAAPPGDRALPAAAHASGPDLEAVGATAPEARTRLCVAARRYLAQTVTSFAWRPVVVVVALEPGRANRKSVKHGPGSIEALVGEASVQPPAE
jgi:hypothetical protein